MISIRVSESEYAAMRAVCTSYGARNISDFARVAVQRAIAGSAAFDPDIATMIREFDVRLNLLEQRVSALAGWKRLDTNVAR